MKPVELADKSHPNSKKPTRINRLILIMVPLLLILGVGYLSWRKIQLYLAQQLIHDCVEHHHCVDQIASLERLVTAKQRLKFFNLATANLKGANLDHAYLYGVNLYRANLEAANLNRAYLYRANLYLANLEGANLNHAYLIRSKNLTPSQIKSACNWSTALYRGKFDSDKLTWIVDEKSNQQFIQQLQQEQASEPQTPVDCSKWSELK